MENGTQAHCPHDEWNREIRSAFSKMRPKYRVSDCNVIFLFLYISLLSIFLLFTLYIPMYCSIYFCSFHANNTECPWNDHPASKNPRKVVCIVDCEKWWFVEIQNCPFKIAASLIKFAIFCIVTEFLYWDNEVSLKLLIRISILYQ